MAAAAASSEGLSETDIERDPAAAAQTLTAALEQKPEHAECYRQRAYAYILLRNYHDAVADAKKALVLEPNNAVAFLRQGIGEYYMKNYDSALKSFIEGQTHDSADSTFPVWIKRCEEALRAPGSQMETAWPSKIKFDWYQTDSHVIVTIMIKHAKQEDVNITFSEKQLNASLKLSSEENYKLKLHLLHSIVPEQSLFKVLSTKIYRERFIPHLDSFHQAVPFQLSIHRKRTLKSYRPSFERHWQQIEIKMKKPETIRWEKLEGQEISETQTAVPASNPTHHYPSSSHHTKNWDKLVVEIKEEEQNEKLEGDAALNKLFQQIYSDGTDEVKRAMNKSFMESGGTVLSTNWSDVGKRKVEVNPPEDMEWKKF